MGIMGKRNEMPVGQDFFFQNVLPLARKKFHWIRCPPDTLGIFCLCITAATKPAHMHREMPTQRDQSGMSQATVRGPLHPPGLLRGPLLHSSAEVERESQEGVKGGHHVYLKLSISHW
jgi:hypothetical protein